VTGIAHIEPLLVGMVLATWIALFARTQVAAEYLANVPAGGVLDHGLPNAVYPIWDARSCMRHCKLTIPCRSAGNSPTGMRPTGRANCASVASATWHLRQSVHDHVKILEAQFKPVRP
jgi:hypothetical protein